MYEETDYEKYEKLVEEIITNLHKEIGAEIEGPKERTRPHQKNLIQGKSGYWHQIDVSFTRKDTGELFLIECKCWNRKIDPAQLLTLYGRVKDIGELYNGCVIGIIASKMGYTKGVEQLYKWADIFPSHVKSVDDFSVTIKNRYFVKPSEGYQTQKGDAVPVSFSPKKE